MTKEQWDGWIADKSGKNLDQYKESIGIKQTSRTSGSATVLGGSTEGVQLIWKGAGGTESYLEGTGLLGMGKREKRKLLKEMKKQRLLQNAGITPISQAQLELAREVTGVEADDLSAELLDLTEKDLMRKAGYSESDIEFLEAEVYFSPAEIMDFVYAGWTATEINWASAHAEVQHLDGEDMLTSFECEAANKLRMKAADLTAVETGYIPLTEHVIADIAGDVKELV